MKTNTENFRLLTLLVLGGILLSGCVGQEGAEEPQPPEPELIKDFLTYESPTHGIRIKYPKDWTMQEGFMGTVVVFLSPKADASDVFQENLSVGVEDLSGVSITLDEYTELTIDQIEQFITDFNVVESGKTTLANNSAYKIVYTGSQAQYSIKWMQIWTIKGYKAYLITYTAETNNYSDFLEIVEAMISSFEFM